MDKSFEEQWQDALNDMSTPPPPDLWNKIEEELDKKERRKVIVFWKTPVFYSGVAAVFFVFLGMVFLISPKARIYDFETNTVAVNSTETKEIISKSEIVEGSKGEKVLSSSIQQLALAENINKSRAVANVKTVVALSRVEGFSNYSLAEPAIEVIAQQVIEERKFDLEKLTSREIAHLANSFQGAPEQIRIEESGSEAELNSKKKEGWFGVLLANAPFEPNFSTPQFQSQALSAARSSDAFMAFDKGGEALPQYNSVRSDAQNSFKRGSAISYGFGIGKRLKKKLSLETGLRYTKATYYNNSNVYVLDKSSGQYNSFNYMNYVANEANNNNVLVSVNGSSKYEYNYLSVPVLLNYELLHLGKLNLNAVGGVSTEFLLSGTVTNGENVSEKFDASNSNFKRVNLAGVGGLKLSYPITNLLDVNLGASYQHFITSGIQNSSDALFKPSMLGVNFGISIRK